MNYPISVFLDTNVFDGCKYHLDDNSILIMLGKLVEKDKVNLYISNIVLREAEKHIKDATENSYKILKTAERESCFKFG
ncbi:PIN domain-containing protein [Alkaliphilus metalliredigens]|uniref:PIN domain-containing protein n=1 Tax=Alkaliphilus metalliredigens TaxID=208226 RepID=UPI0005A032C5|nr:PIN domain-containing protein [Alkaliphilus metalliredigens]